MIEVVAKSPRRDVRDARCGIEQNVAHPVLSFQLVQQPFRLLQIRRVKSLGEPLVHWRQQLVGVLVLVLGLPQAGQAGGGVALVGA